MNQINNLIKIYYFVSFYALDKTTYSINTLSRVLSKESSWILILIIPKNKIITKILLLILGKILHSAFTCLYY